jgi:DNA-binding CsgD family transcriptional regulator
VRADQGGNVIDSTDAEAGRPAIAMHLLNEGERTALALLAEGHTVKTIAAATGRSVAAINERLREARRKTGIGSSRELARLLRVQENRDKKIDLAVPAAPGAIVDPGPAAWRRGPMGKGGIAMASLLLTGLAAAWLITQTQSPITPSAAASPPLDRGIDALIRQRGPEPRDLHVELLGQGRDPAWADRTEALLRTHYSAVPHFSDAGAARIRCAATLCEVVSLLPEKLPLERLRTLDWSLQSGRFRAEMARLGLDHLDSLFTSTHGRPLYVAYWGRAAAKRPTQDPLLDGVLPKHDEATSPLYARVRTEGRDPAWAGAMEERLRQIYGRVPDLDGPASPLRVTCAATLCEVTASTPPGANDAAIHAFFDKL